MCGTYVTAVITMGQQLQTDTEILEELKHFHDCIDPSVDSKLRAGGEEGLTNQTLRRWLVARKMNIQVAKADLEKHADWRSVHVPNGRICEEEVQDNLDDKKNFLQGFDKHGNPVMIVYVARHVPKKLESISKYICYCLDSCERLGQTNPNWGGKYIGMLYLTGMTLANYDVTGLRAIFDMLQNHFPERLECMYLYDAPMIFYALWKVVSPFVDPVTRKKVVFVYPKDVETVLHASIPKEILPAELGGTGQWLKVKSAWELILEGSVDVFTQGGHGATA
ncbi:hypothetical protein CEUSTIGMA_g9799.t1 [Chlamydomonas eustigma]|uniref:CRAL-TRIO domain-containing protein n=1 Tax=Chlamydomonas eustigma TaxID=1157962 RepID=A0A250XHU4_9CHLO|nr:hypothetical protein CEUSTIGMA_g9799.t1 [Chlamydomonas eustigma]|eukprot:GAX82370.1 hypothetical protein CEUSTIGMA_g9799.t1 [Chlamydomonas eustigma]